MDERLIMLQYIKPFNRHRTSELETQFNPVSHTGENQMKKLVYGIGINDADYIVRPIINKTEVVCPFYRTWKNMLMRVYSVSYQTRRPTYIGTTVCDEWHSFMNFRSWMEHQDWQGLQLDKDILFPNNKHYSPKTCVFVTRSLNQLFVDCGAARGKYPTGVSWNKKRQRFVSEISLNTKRTHLGYYDTAKDAHKAYLLAKIEHTKTFYSKVDKKVQDGLKRHIKILKKGLTT